MAAQQKVFNMGERRILFLYLSATPALNIHLISAPTVYTDANVAADFTESTFDGYSPQVIAGGALAVGNPGGDAMLVWNQVTFTKAAGTANENVVGYWIEDDDTGEALWGEIFDPVRPMDVAGNELKITPRFRLRSAS